jgi:hypothetical protein
MCLLLYWNLIQPGLARQAARVEWIRDEDTLAVTESGCEKLGPRCSGTPEEPAVG